MSNSSKIVAMAVLLALPGLLWAQGFTVAAPAASGPSTSPASRPASAPARVATAQEIKDWAKALADESWRVREEAQARLIECGEAAVAEVQASALGGDPEVKQRSQVILAEIAKSASASRAAAVLKNELWKAKLDEPVASRPTVAKGLVCLRSGSGAVTALDALTGAVKWTFTPENKGAPDAVPTAPVLVEDGTALVTWPGGALYALDLATGKPRWQLDSEGGVTDPVAAGGLVFVCGRQKNVLALSLEKGEQQWAVEADNTFSVAPIICGDFLVVAPEKGGLIGIDWKTGKRTWASAAASITAGLAAVSDEAFAWRTAEGLTLCNGKTGEIKWSNGAAQGVAGVGNAAANVRMKIMMARMNGAGMGVMSSNNDIALAVDGNTIYTSMGDQVAALDANSGAQLWTFKPGAKQGEAPAANAGGPGGGAIVINGGGNIRIQAQVMVINGGMAKNVMMVNGVPVGSGALSGPCVHDGLMYVGSAAGLHAVDLKTQLEVWRIDAKGVTVQPFVVDGVLYFVTNRAEPNPLVNNAGQPAAAPDPATPADDYILHAIKLKK